MSPFEKINCHSHYLPASRRLTRFPISTASDRTNKEYRKALAENEHSNPDGMPAIQYAYRTSQDS